MKKSVCLTVSGISIVVAAVALGVALTRYLGLLGYSPKGTAQAAAAAAGPGVPATPPEQWNNIFAPADGMKLASRLPSADPKTASLATRTNFVLVGTIASSTHSIRRAILWANGMKEPKAFREKEEVEPGAFLASVERDKVWITRGKEREKLEILPVGTRVRPTAPKAGPVPPPPPPAEAAPPLPALPTGASALPSAATATRPPPGRTRTVTAPPPPGASSGDDDEESHVRRKDRRRPRGIRR